MMVNGMINRLHYRFKVLFRRFGLVVMLILAIGISIALSVSLWRSPGRDLNHDKSNADATQQVVASKSLTDLYGFDQLVYNEDNVQYSVIDYRPTTTKMIKRLTTWEVGDYTKQKLTDAEYLKTLSKKGTVLMSFPDAVAGGVVNQLMTNDVDLPANAEINRIRVPQESKNEILFMDDKHRTIYRYAVKNAAKSLDSFKMSDERVKVKFELNGKRVLTDALESVSLRSYSYLMETNATNNYLSALFAGTTTPSANRNGNTLTYNDGVSRQMTVDTVSGVAKYDAYDVSDLGKTFNQRMAKGYDWLVRIHQIPDNIYFFESHDMGRHLIYRLYVNGLPIFNQTAYGTVQMKQHDSRHQEIDFSQYSLQVPLPADNNVRVTLPTSDEVIKKLAGAGVPKKSITNMAYGYRWVSDTNQNIVTLQPEWYFEVGNTWQAVNDKLAENQGGAN
ncbi:MULTISPECIES: YycH family regulatory protein [Weissella]|uniref:YycH family regulatory protein n=2 Tax=Weissella TaxID=46255 RepID=A0ABT6D2F0_9LACO|nr:MULTISPECIES: YycH family regulatory protein [unclassified Weissella]MCW0927079.1 YycH family regulatory protein [Weissella sp. LMG 11983]MDF9299517.1 YycH family regulatory protein [Weissella sp. BK2]